jgi:hypothetical protein
MIVGSFEPGLHTFMKKTDVHVSVCLLTFVGVAKLILTYLDVFK